MNDLISRKSAMEAVRKMFAVTPTQKDMVEDCLGILDKLPSAEPEQKQGRWIVDEDGMIHCSACANIPTNRIMDAVKVLYDIHPFLMNYCPNCGARMVGDSE